MGKSGQAAEKIDLFACLNLTVLETRISRRQCLINQEQAKRQPQGFYKPCLTCEVGRVISETYEGEVPKLGKIGFCKNHPDKQEWKGRGLCLDCLRANAKASAAKRKKKNLLQIKENMGLVGEQPQAKGPVAMGTTKAMAEQRESMAAGTEEAAPLCGRCKQNPAKLNSRGKSTGLCVECQREHLAKHIHEPGKGGNPHKENIYVNFKGARKLYDWLLAEAERQERTPAQQVRFLLRQSMESIERARQGKQI